CSSSGFSRRRKNNQIYHKMEVVVQQESGGPDGISPGVVANAVANIPGGPGQSFVGHDVEMLDFQRDAVEIEQNNSCDHPTSSDHEADLQRNELITEMKKIPNCNESDPIVAGSDNTIQKKIPPAHVVTTAKMIDEMEEPAQHNVREASSCPEASFDLWGTFVVSPPDIAQVSGEEYRLVEENRKMPMIVPSARFPPPPDERREDEEEHSIGSIVQNA
ncbi:unnamed protein product, partial [Amoebophrya sp. A25]